MKKHSYISIFAAVLSVLLLSALFINGCSSSGSGSDPGPTPSPSPTSTSSPSPSPSPSPTSPYTGVVTGFITDEESTDAIEGADVYVNLGDASAGRTIIMDTTKEDGSYRLTQMPPGEYTLNAGKAGYTASSATISVKAGEETGQDLTLAVIPMPGGVSGTITDIISGNPLSGAEVKIGPLTTYSGADGTYLIEGLEPGIQNVTVTRIDYRSHPSSGTDTVTVEAGQTAAKNVALTRKVWSNIEVERITSPATNLGQYSSLGFGADGKAVISYYDSTNQDLKVAGDIGGLPPWPSTTVDSTGNVGQYSSIAMNKNGYPTVAYYDLTGTDLKYAWFNDLLSLWVVETAVSSTGIVGQHNSIAYYPSGDAAVSYYYGTNPYGLYFVRRTVVDGTVFWSTPVGVDTSANVGQYTSIKFNSSGYPTISYYDVTNTDLKFAEYNGSWQTTAVHASSANVGQYSSLAYASDGQPAIAYYDATNLDLLYIKRNGGVWGAPQTIDATGTVGQYASLAFSPQGYPCIAYYDATTGVQDLKFAWYDGQGWQTETVYSTGNVGQYASLAFDAAGNPGIAYYDATNTSLRYSVKK